jgi:hypothetical protein
MIAVLWMFGCASVGDTVAEDDFAATFAPLFCDREKECARGLYDSLYFDRADCIAHWELSLADQVARYGDADCDYDAKEAASAYEALAELSCDEYYEGEEVAALGQDIWPDCSDTTTSYYYGYYTYYEY